MWSSQITALSTMSQQSSTASAQLTHYEQAQVYGSVMQMSRSQNSPASTPVPTRPSPSEHSQAHAPTQSSGAEIFTRAPLIQKPTTGPAAKFIDTLSSTSSWAMDSISAVLGRSKASKPEKMNLSAVRLRFELCLQDMEGTHVQTLRMRIRNASEIKELWLMRSDIHGSIAKRFNQQEAARRINELLPCFVGWVPEKLLSSI